MGGWVGARISGRGGASQASPAPCENCAAQILPPADRRAREAEEEEKKKEKEKEKPSVRGRGTGPSFDLLAHARMGCTHGCAWGRTQGVHGIEHCLHRSGALQPVPVAPFLDTL